jgi:hypothetical protein
VTSGDGVAVRWHRLRDASVGFDTDFLGMENSGWKKSCRIYSHAALEDQHDLLNRCARGLGELTLRVVGFSGKGLGGHRLRTSAPWA